MFIAVILIYIVIGLCDGRGLVKKKERKKLFFYIFLMLFSMVINVMLSAGIKLYSPAKAIEELLALFLGKNLMQ